MRGLVLGLRLLRRDWRAGEVAALAFALLLAVAASTAVNLAAERLRHALAEQAAEMLGADLLLASHQPLPAEWLERADALGLHRTQVVEFPSMAAAGERFLLVSVKAVESGYPLLGALRTTRDAAGPDAVAQGIPASGEAWADARVLAELGIPLDGELELGRLRLKVTQLISHEPDRRPDFYSLSPRLLVNAADLPASGLIRAGSRAHWYGLAAGPQWPALKTWLQPRLQEGQRLLDVGKERPELDDTVARAERYLGLAAVAVVLLSGVAVVSATRRYAQRHYDTVAMLRCLGARRRQVRAIVASQLLVVGLVTAAVGVVLGWLAQEGLLYWLRPLLPVAPAASGWLPAAMGAGSGLLVLAGFAWPALLRLERLAPLRVLRRDLEPPPPSAWLFGAVALAVAALLVWRYTGDGLLTALLLAGLGVLVLAVAGLAWVLLVLSRRWRPADLASRFALRSLNRHPGHSLAQVVAFAITLAAMALSLVVRDDLVEDWRSRLEARAPNYFVINLLEAERERFLQRLAEVGAEASGIYPVVRGRLTEINGRPAQSFAEKDSQGERALNRELNLTWTAELPIGNRIVAGEWWRSEDTAIQSKPLSSPPAPAQELRYNHERHPPFEKGGSEIGSGEPLGAGSALSSLSQTGKGSATAGVSLEQKLAESLHVTVGDRLTFTLAGRPLEATVTSLRGLRWDSMTPNFYAIFSPGALQGFSYSYLTSFFLPSERRAGLASLSREFPAVTLLDVDQLLRQMQSVLRQVTLAVDGVLGFALAAGVAVLWAAVLNQVDERLREDALLRVLGAERRLLRRGRRMEFALLGALAGLVAAVAAEVLVWALYRQVLHMDFALHGRLWLGLPVVGALLVAVCGLALTRRAVAASPLAVLRED